MCVCTYITMHSSYPHYILIHICAFLYIHPHYSNHLLYNLYNTSTLIITSSLFLHITFLLTSPHFAHICTLFTVSMPLNLHHSSTFLQTHPHFSVHLHTYPHTVQFSSTFFLIIPHLTHWSILPMYDSALLFSSSFHISLTDLFCRCMDSAPLFSSSLHIALTYLYLCCMDPSGGAYRCFQQFSAAGCMDFIEIRVHNWWAALISHFTMAAHC